MKHTNQKISFKLVTSPNEQKVKVTIRKGKDGKFFGITDTDEIAEFTEMSLSKHPERFLPVQEGDEIDASVLYQDDGGMFISPYATCFVKTNNSDNYPGTITTPNYTEDYLRRIGYSRIEEHIKNVYLPVMDKIVSNACESEKAIQRLAGENMRNRTEWMRDNDIQIVKQWYDTEAPERIATYFQFNRMLTKEEEQTFGKLFCLIPYVTEHGKHTWLPGDLPILEIVESVS